MKDEIKLMLNIIKDVSEHKVGSRNGLMILSCKDYKTLYDYITNLQQLEQETNATLMSELAKLEEENERLQARLNGCDELLENDMKTINNYKSRCEKASEYIDKQKKKMYKSRNKIAMFILMKLENILQNGSDSQ